MSLSISLVLAITAASAPVQVDEGVTEIRTCRVSALTFRTATDGWMFDHCGAAFRSSDGGRSWRPAPEVEGQLFGVVDHDNLSPSFHAFIQHALWLSETTGLAFSYGTQSVFRTEDAGRTWKAAALPDLRDSEMIYGVDHLRDHVWFCGSTGRVSRSTDAGRTWTSGTQLFDQAGSNQTNWCAALSFLDANDGWAAGWRTLWRTTDGGVTWSEAPPILAPATTATRPEEVRGMVRLSPLVAWARTKGNTLLRTQDGGKHWSSVTRPRFKPGVVRRQDGRAIVVATGLPKGRKIEESVPLVNDQWVAVGPDGAMNEDLDLYDRGALARRGPAVSPPSGHTVALQGRTAADGSEWGWEGASVFRTDDAGRSWRRTGSLPAPATRLVSVSRVQVLGRAGADLYRSDDGGKTWRVANDAAVRADWARLTGDKSAAPKSNESVECALRGPASISLDFGVQGCFGGTEDSLSLTIAANGRGHLKGAVKEWNATEKRMVTRTVDRALSKAEATKAVRQLSSDVARLEKPSGCESTTRTFARLAWACGKSATQTLEYETNDCAPRMPFGVGGETRSGSLRGDGYSRAAGLKTTAQALLNQPSPK